MNAPTATVKLRPRSVADLVDEMVWAYQRKPNAGLFFAVSALVWLPASVFIAAGSAMMTPIGVFTDPAAFAASTFGAGVGLLVVGVLVAFFTYPILIGALTDVVARRYLGRAARVSDALRVGLGSYFRIVGAYLLLLAAVLAVFVVTGVVAILAARVGGTVAIVVSLLAFLAALAGMIWLVATWEFVVAVIVVERRGTFASIARSAELARRNRWRIIGLNLLLGIVVYLIFSLPIAMLAVGLSLLPSGFALAQVVTAVAQAASFPLQLGPTTLLYYDVRVRREGLDLVLAAEGLPPA